MRQIVFGLFAEGETDYKFFPALLERYLAHSCYARGVDSDILPTIIIRRDADFPARFVETMKLLEGRHSQLSYIFVHNDADSRSLENVLDNKWGPWLGECENESMWVAVIPIKMTESWMLVDVEALKSTFIISEQSLQEILGTADPESVTDPKAKLGRIIRAGRQRRTTNYQENLANRIRFDLLERLPSFQFLKDQIEERIK